MKVVFLALLVFTHFEAIVLECVDIQCSSPGGRKECGHPSIYKIISIKSINAKTPKETYKECDDGRPPDNRGPFVKPKCHTVTIRPKPCQKRVMFGFKQRKIWVDKRCSGKFHVCYVPVEGCVSISCSSSGGKTQCGHSQITSDHQITSISTNNAQIPAYTKYCSEDNRSGEPFKKPKVCSYPAVDCKEGREFGFYTYKMWITSKCKGQFNVCYKEKSKFDCANRHFTSGVNLKWYPIDINNDVQIMTVYVKQSNTCIAKSTYWYKGKRVWLKNKCKGYFRVCVDKIVIIV